jgi:hypothetical protein
MKAEAKTRYDLASKQFEEAKALAKANDCTLVVANKGLQYQLFTANGTINMYPTTLSIPELPEYSKHPWTILEIVQHVCTPIIDQADLLPGDYL